MKISFNWLQDYIQTDLPLEKITEILTDIGLEVEGTAQVGISDEDLENFIVGEVLTCMAHPNADKLKLTTVDAGNGEILQIVCGAPNVAEGQKVPVAKIGAIIRDDKGGEFTIKKAKLRGESSHGMICSKKELRLSNDHEGIWVMDANLSAGTPLANVINTTSDTVIEIGLTPNRADAMSHFGVARDLYVALKSRNLNVQSKFPQFSAIATSSEKNPFAVELVDTTNCLRYAGIYMKDVVVGESPLWLQNRLKTIGLSPKNIIVDITNYILHGLGQPMHAFDADKIADNTIIVKSGEYGQTKLNTLDKIERELRGDELLICDTQKPIAIGGVMGGLDTAVTDQTTNIFLESAYFNPVSVRKTSKNHNINSDSSFRFERGIDPNITIQALQMAVAMISDLAGGKVVGNLIDLYPKPISNQNIVLHYRNVDKLLGERLHREKIKEILQLLEIDIIHETPELLELDVTAYRVDVLREADLIEEILRIYGFNTIQNPEKMSMALVSGDGFEDHFIENTLAENLVSLGFFEAMNMSMYKKQYNDWLHFNDSTSINILNSLSGDLAVMRRSLLPGLLENLDFNLKRKKENIKLFELGNSYESTKDGYSENRTLAITLTGNQKDESWQSKPQKVDFSYARGVLNHLFEKFGLKKLKINEAENSYNSQSLQFSINQNIVAQLNKIPSDLLQQFDIEQEVIFIEIYLTEFKKAFQESKGTKFIDLPKFPAVRRDLALLLDKNITYQTVEDIVMKSDADFIQKVNLFDVYEGDKLPMNKKSYAINIQMQDADKTMNDKQIDAIINKVVSRLEKEVNAELRT